MVETSEGPLDRMDSFEEARVDGDPKRQLLSRAAGKENSGKSGRLTPRERVVFEMRHYQGLRLRASVRYVGYLRRGRQELSVPRHAKNAECLRRFCMKCEEAIKNLPLFLYGELSFEEEERLEAHIDECAGCRRRLAPEKLLFKSLDAAESGIPSQELLGSMPRRLRESLQHTWNRNTPGSGTKSARVSPSTSTSRPASLSPSAPLPCS